MRGTQAARKGARAGAEKSAITRLLEVLGEFIGASPDCALVAWSGAEGARVLGAAGSCKQVLGAGAGALVGTPAGNLFRGGERAARDLVAACAGGSLSTRRDLMRVGGARRGRPFAAHLLLRSEGEGSAVALVRDLAAAQSSDDAALREEDLARFAALVAHEVRNPLSSVKIALQTLERGGLLPPNDLRRVAIAVREVGSIEALLSEVLDFARPLSLSLVPLDPRGVLAEAVQQLEGEWSGRGVHFSLKLPARMSPVLADPVRLSVAVSILGRQGAAFAEEVGGGEVQVQLKDGRTAWELSVRDPGRPLAKELRPKAFTPFTPRRAQGSGLGLAVVARIAREHGGEASMGAWRGGNEVRIRTPR